MVNFHEVTVKVEEGGPLPVQITAPWSSSQRISQQADDSGEVPRRTVGKTMEKPWKTMENVGNTMENHGKTVEKPMGGSAKRY